MSPIKCSSSELLENVAISVSLASGENLTVVSSYCLKGNCRKEDITKLLGISSLYVIGGDFNAHHDLWDSSGPCNSVGRAIFSALNESDHACLLTPRDLATRMCPANGTHSTIDLTLIHRTLLLDALITTGYIGSDHLPILNTLNEEPLVSGERDPLWKFKKNPLV